MKPGIVITLPDRRGMQQRKVMCDAAGGKTDEPCGVCTRCKKRASCRRWQAVNKNEARAATDRWRKANLQRARDKAKQWKIENPELHKARHLREYNLTTETFNEMLSQQSGRCALCPRVFDEKTKLNIDHCHTTGRIRALLCAGCNIKVGFYEKTLHRHTQFAEYVGVNEFDYVWDAA